MEWLCRKGLKDWPCILGTVVVKPARACGSILKSTSRGAFAGGAVATEPIVGDIEIEWTRELTLLIWKRSIPNVHRCRWG